LVRRYVVEQLGALGYRILEAGTGAAALALVAAGKRFDLLFTDVMLPGGVLGPDLLEQMRDKLPGLRALFTSGYSEGHVLPRERGAGEVRLLQKPYSRQRLAAEIRAALDAKTT
jgi:CheY-like chemotaxis protein